MTLFQDLWHKNTNSFSFRRGICHFYPDFQICNPNASNSGFFNLPQFFIAASISSISIGKPSNKLTGSPSVMSKSFSMRMPIPSSRM